MLFSIIAIGIDHLGDQLGAKVVLLPAELGRGLARVAEQQIDLGRPEIARIDRDQHLAGALAHAALVDAAAAPVDVAADLPKASSTNSRTECVSPVAST